MIAWKYVNKTNAVILAIRDYKTMRTLINITPQEIKDLYDDITNLQSSKITGIPHGTTITDGKDGTVASLDRLDAMQERYRQAIEYMQWFEPVWSSLSDNEQTILREFYDCENRKSGAAKRLMSRLNYSERQLHRVREKALARLEILLFGRC